MKHLIPLVLLSLLFLQCSTNSTNEKNNTVQEDSISNVKELPAYYFETTFTRGGLSLIELTDNNGVWSGKLYSSKMEESIPVEVMRNKDSTILVAKYDGK